METKILQDIQKYRNNNKSSDLARFFKTGPGQYGEGDVFWGLDVPTCRKIAERYMNISRKDVSRLLINEVHEVRFVALLVLVAQYKKAKTELNDKEQESIVKFYLDNTKHVNNWDLVDSSAHQILGDFLKDKTETGDGGKRVLLTLSHSKDLWEQRIAIVATFAFIRQGELEWTFKIVDTLMRHQHDLIHKACGWMLREAGKRDMEMLKKYLDKNVSIMPRTMLRYAIEKFPEPVRLEYLKK